MQKYRNISSAVDSSTDIEEPKNPIGVDMFAQYKAAIMEIHRRQVAEKINSVPREMIWTDDLIRLKEMIKTRGPRIRKKNHVEKLDHEFAPYTAIREIGNIEASLFNMGVAAPQRKAFASLT